jgi:predicted  nucleic acid-binding Zn-ribbon protein
MASVVEKFTDLEERIMRAIEVIKSTRMEKEAVERRLQSAQAEIAKLEHELEQLHRERDLIRTKIESLVDALSSQLAEGTVV